MLTYWMAKFIAHKLKIPFITKFHGNETNNLCNVRP